MHSSSIALLNLLSCTKYLLYFRIFFPERSVLAIIVNQYLADLIAVSL